MVESKIGEEGSKPPSTEQASVTANDTDAQCSSGKGDQPPKEIASLPLASPAPSAGEVPLTEDEVQTSAILKARAIKQSLQQASVDRQLAAISEEWSKGVHNDKIGKNEVPFALSLLKDLFDIRFLVTQDEKFRLELECGLLNVLTLLRKKYYVSADFAEKTRIELFLRRVRQPSYGFSFVAQSIAEGLYGRFERQDWGKRVAHAATITPAIQEKAEQSKRKRGTSQANPQKEQKPKAHVDEIHIKKPIPKDDDPVFGVTGSMRGTLIKYNTVDRENVSKSIVLNPEVKQINSKVFGHNGIKIGQIFPRQMAALAQGAHGSSQAGISGSADGGAYSVIVTGTYSDLEKDGLTRFEYCAVGSMENTSKDAIVENTGLKALRTSHVTRKPIRVLRGQNEKFHYAPRFGYRYDGLYTVEEEKGRTNGKGGLYAVFVLKRVEDQGHVVLSRPNAADFEQFELLKARLE